MSRSKVLEERLCRIARGSVLEPALAEDVVQDASLAALRARA